MMLVSQKSRQRMVEIGLAHFTMWREDGKGLVLDETAVAHYLTGALISLLLWWIDNGMAQSPAEMNELFQQLSGLGLTIK